MRGEVGRARGDGLHGPRVPDQSGQVERGARLHDEAAARKDEADFRLGVRDAHVHGERHGDTDADGGAVQGPDCGLARVRYG